MFQVKERVKVFRGERLTQARNNAALTQEELGDMIGASSQQISAYEHGKREPFPYIIIKLAEALGTTTDWLLGLSDKPQREVKEVTTDELSYLRKLDRKKLLELLQIILKESNK